MNVIAIDFDETINCENSEKTMRGIIKVNQLFENPDNFIVIYTSRSYSQFNKIRRMLREFDVKYHALVCEKIRATTYIDDRNAGGLIWP